MSGFNKDWFKQPLAVDIQLIGFLKIEIFQLSAIK